jgi:Tol biopolymer transport system component
MADDDDRNAQIYVIDADGTDLQQITDEGENRWPTWSPDGSRIAFVRDGGLYTMAPDGSDVRELEGVRPEGPIAWNPVPIEPGG